MPEDKHNWIDDVRKSKNNFSFWFPKIENCGIAVHKSTVIPVPDEIVKSFFLEDEGDENRIRTFIHERVMPVIDSLDSLPFIKNGCFSGKFDFSKCCPPSKDEETIIKCIKSIQYDSLCFETGGYTELVIRERIDSPDSHPRIYNGMPLNTEFRVFYDFDSHTPLYIVNYWDWDYCHEAIERQKDDGKAYGKYYQTLLNDYNKNCFDVFTEVIKTMRENKSLKNVWSIDILKDSTGKLWLIDMAEAERSTYWDMNKGISSLFFNRFENYIKKQLKDTDCEKYVRSWAFFNLITDQDKAEEYYRYLKNAYVKIASEINGREMSVSEVIKKYAKKDERTNAMIESYERFGALTESNDCEESAKQYACLKTKNLENTLFLETIIRYV